MTTPPPGPLVDNASQSRFEMAVGDAVAFVVYRVGPDAIHLLHAEVPPELEGRGVGSELVRRTLETVRARGQKAVPRCSFVRAYVARHPEYRDVIA